MRTRRLTTALVAVAASAALALTACGSDSSTESKGSTSSSSSDSQFPLTIDHALGETKIPSQPKRVATVNWSNQEVPLALGITPVGMAKANFGVEKGKDNLPWVEEKLEELGGEKPVLFDETDGIDFEAVADSKPDVILAAYSGLTKEDYSKLSKIAPTVAYPTVAWGTSWQDSIKIESEALGMKSEGEKLLKDLEGQIDEAKAKHPELSKVSAMFLTHVDTKDMSKISFYTTHDTRPMFFNDLGMKTPKSIAEASAKTDQFSGEVSAERADQFDDVDIIVTYGGDEVKKALEADPVLKEIPAVKNDAIVALPNEGPLGTAANPTPLAVPYVLGEYTDLLAKAAAKADSAE
ncbi:MAG: iron-siderophore ABC transporter substrate-binding protein [Galactobacter sp.]